MPADAVPNTLWPRLSEVIAERTGLHFPPERHGDLQRGLSNAAAELGFADSAACADWLLSTPPTERQLLTLASHLTIGETYFFRDPKTFNALAQHVLPELIRARAKERRLRIWSAACSTGEEAYSLAILLKQLAPDWRVTLLATDINSRFLQKAGVGLYSEWSFRDSPPGFKERYFTRTSDGRFQIVPEIKKRVTFAQLNLAEDRFPSLATHTNAMDLILCRNVIMYFTPEQTHRLVGNLHRSLVDDGWLAVSAIECSQSLFSGFAVVNFPGAILYRKRPWFPEPVSGALPMLPPPIESTESGTAAEPSTDELQAEAGAEARALANAGKLSESLACIERWLAADKLNAAAHYLHAMVSQELGNGDTARRSLQRAVYLDPDFALAHFALGNLARRDARNTDAARHFDNALRLLRSRPADEEVPESDGLTAGRLTEIISALSSRGDLAS
jgi:chemotaxis protein methyltransferase CheR